MIIVVCLNIYCRLMVHIQLQIILKKHCVNTINKINMQILSKSQGNHLYRNKIKPIDIDIKCMHTIN